MKLISWNVNGLKSAEENFLKLISEETPDLVLLQEVRNRPEDLSFFLTLLPGYQSFFNPSNKAGYSGTAVYCSEKVLPENVSLLDDHKFLSTDGRSMLIDLEKIAILNFYVPNGGGLEKLGYKLNFLDEALSLINSLLEKGKSVIVGGDLNIAREGRDLSPNVPYFGGVGISSQEREKFNKLLELGLIDTFRHFNKNGDSYTWWHPIDKNRTKNLGIRFDYFLASRDLESKLEGVKILKNILGSDHCPIMLELS